MSNAYVSCHCRGCRAVSAEAKVLNKRSAHRRLRHQARVAIQKDREPHVVVTTGYLS